MRILTGCLFTIIGCFYVACQSPISPLEDVSTGLWCPTDSEQKNSFLWIHPDTDSIAIQTGSWQAYPLLYKEGQLVFSVFQLSINPDKDTLWLMYPEDLYGDKAPVPYVPVSLSQALPASWEEIALDKGYWEVDPMIQRFPYYRIFENESKLQYSVVYSNTDSLLKGTVEEVKTGMNYDWELQDTPFSPETMGLKGRTLIRPTHYKTFFGWHLEGPNDYSFWVIDKWQQGEMDTMDLKAITGPSTGKRSRWIRRVFE